MFAYTKLMQAMVGAGTVSDPQFYLTTLLLNTSSTNGAQNNTFLDSSSNNFTITRNGNTTQGTFTPFSQTGWSNYITSPTSNYLYSPSNVPAFTGDFTIECWVRLNSLASTAIITSSSGATPAWDLYINSTGTVVWYTGSAIRITTSLTISLNTWTHVALVRSAGVAKIYINGNADSNTYSSSATIGTGSSFLYIGRDSGASAGFDGYISNYRLAVGAAVYTSNFTPPTAPLGATTGGQNPPTGTQTYLLTCQSNSFIDNSGNSNTPIIVGTPSVQAFSPFAPTAAYSTSVVGGSGYFGASGDNLTRAFTSTTDGMYIQGSTYTIEAWVYPLALSGTQYIYICNATNVASYGYNSLYLSGTSAAFATRVATSGTEYAISGGTLTVNQWAHIAVTVSSNSAKLFLNGTQVGSTTTIAADTFTPTGAGIGQNQNGAAGGTNFTGYISNLRITQGQALASGNFTTPTSPVTTSSVGWTGANAASSLTGTVSFLLSAANSGIYDAAAKNDMQTVGNAQVSTTQAKFGTTSMYFDGTGDWLISPASAFQNLGTSDFTIDGWFYFTTTASVQSILGTWSASPSRGWFFYFDTTLKMSFTYSTTGANAVDASFGYTPTTNTWVYLALVRSGADLKFYANGVQQGSTHNISTSSIYANNQPLYVGERGSSTGGAFNGYMDELRVTRYARTITTPTAAFPVQ